MRRYISAFMITIALLTGIGRAQTGHGTHTPGTIGAVGNNGTGTGGSGRDVLVGGTGADRAGVTPTGSVIFFTGLEIAVSGVQLLSKIR
jgi:hypothetical protein